jgi:endonuclease YncB( thermonuclease family)
LRWRAPAAKIAVRTGRGCKGLYAWDESVGARQGMAMRTPLLVYRLRRRLRGLDLALLALSLGIALTGAAAFVILAERPPGTPAGAGLPPAASEAQDPAPAAAGSKLAVRMEAAAVEEMRRRPDTDLSGLPPMELPPPLISIDGSGFRRGEETIRLDRIAGPRTGDVCLDGVQRWACGLQARAALHNLVAGRSLFCQPRRALADGGIAADCRLDARDALPAGNVAHLLVRRGWARPVPESASDFAAEVAEAQAERAGLWRGGWSLSTP